MAGISVPSELICPSCERQLPAGSPVDLCPYCLLSPAPDSMETSNWAARGAFVPPRRDELQAHFDPAQLEIRGLIGRGGMGAVYRAWQPRLNRDVAIKVLPPEIAAQPGFDDRFAREAQVLARLDHGNIVDVYDFGKAGPYSYLVLEFVDGANLRELLCDGHINAQEALQIVPQICAALQFAHDKGVVHRDVKPENILIDTQGRVKIMDFGLAKLVGGPQDVHLTATRQVMGTLHYMAPEQIERPQEVDHRADIFALGVVFYEMLTGELPLGRFDPPSRKLGTSRSLDRVVMRTLEKEPSRRYDHASDLGSDVDQFREHNQRPPVRLDFAGHYSETIATLRDWLDPRNQLILFTWLFYTFLIGGILLALNCRRGEEVLVCLVMTGLCTIVISLFSIRPTQTVNMAPGDWLKFYSTPMRLLGRPGRIAMAISDALQLQRGSASTGHAVIGWVFMAVSLIFLMIAVTEDDDFFPGCLLFAFLAFLAGRLALPRKPHARLNTGDKWLVYPLLLTTLVPIVFIFCLGPGLLTFTLLMDGPRRYRPNGMMRVLSAVYLAAVVQCLWWSVGCFLLGKFPRATRFLLHPFAQEWEGRGAYALAIVVLIAGIGGGVFAIPLIG